MFVLTLAFASALVRQAKASLPYRPPWLPKVWWAVGMCETHLDWHFANSTYVSAFGIYRGAWAQFRPSWVPRVPERATPRQQYAVALAIYRRYGFSGWGCVTHGGYKYWMGRS